MGKVSAGQGWGILGLILVVIVVAAAAALPGRETVDFGDPLPQDWDKRLSTDTALVASKHATGGVAFLGFQFTGKTYLLDLHFLASPDCDGPGDGDATSTTCDGPDGLTGEPVGITPTGDVILSTRVEVSRQCFELTSVADGWPPAAQCALE